MADVPTLDTEIRGLERSDELPASTFGGVEDDVVAVLVRLQVPFDVEATAVLDFVRCTGA